MLDFPPPSYLYRISKRRYRNYKDRLTSARQRHKSNHLATECQTALFILRQSTRILCTYLASIMLPSLALPPFVRCAPIRRDSNGGRRRTRLPTSVIYVTGWRGSCENQQTKLCQILKAFSTHTFIPPRLLANVKFIDMSRVLCAQGRPSGRRRLLQGTTNRL